MKTIWKFKLEITDQQEIEIPGFDGYKSFLKASFQGENLCLWAMCDPEQPKKRVKIRIYGTGNPIEYGGGVSLAYIDSASTSMYMYARNMVHVVWHVFWETTALF